MGQVVNLPDSCTVRMDGELHESHDFVAILAKKNGDTSIYYNTDALTLGMAVKLTAKQFVEQVSKCSPEDQLQIQGILGDAFILEGINKDGQDTVKNT